MSEKKTFVGWTFTSFLDEEPEFDSKKLRCMIFQREKAATTGRLHWQGACRTLGKHGLTFKSIQKILPKGAHIEPSNGSWEDNVRYCSKSETQVGETKILGDPPAFGEELKLKKQCRLTPLIDMAKNGASMKQMIEFDGPTAIRNYRALGMVSNLYEQDEKPEFDETDFNTDLFDFEQKALVFIGPTGIGKTEFALAHFKNPLIVSHIDDLKRYNKFEHDGLVFDDFKADHWPTTCQIHLVDWNHGRSINVKCATAYIPARTKKIFTCNEYPFSYHPAIERRIRRIDFTSDLKKLEHFVETDEEN